MTRFEQQVMARTIPFYKWSRHVTQLVGDLAVHHPARLVWTMQMSNLFNTPGDSIFPDSISAAGGMISIGNLSPLGQFSNLYFNEKGPLAGVGSSLNPLLKVGAAALTGVNTTRGFAPLRLPPGSGNTDDFGNPQNTSLLGRPRDLLHYGAAQVPLLRTGLDLAHGQKLARYDTGQPMLRGGHLIDATPRIPGTGTSGRFGILAKQAGIPTVTPFTPEADVKATAAKRRASAKKSRERYARQLKQAER
jgi:hypothetical protein